MNPKFNKILLIVPAITAFLLSRLVFFFIDDPEGPNLLIVFVLAVFIYLLSLSLYLYKHSERTVLKQTMSVIVFQIITSLILCFLVEFF